MRISLFGGIHIEQEGSSAQVKLTHTVQALLAYLLVYRQRTHSREVLANLFWGEYSQERARNCLNTAIWRLRRVLETEGVSAGTYLISTPMGGLGFNTKSNFWLDVEKFEDQMGRILAIPLERATANDIVTLEEVTKLYTGDLLEGYYSDWALRERERLRCCYLDCLYYLVRYFSIKDGILKALSYGQEILNIDPLREDVHRHMMRLYIKNGQRSLAVRQYNICRQALETELGIPPMSETQTLFKQIIDADITSVTEYNLSLLEQYQTIERLQNAIESVNRAKENLEWLLEQFNKPL